MIAILDNVIVGKLIKQGFVTIPGNDKIDSDDFVSAARSLIESTDPFEFPEEKVFVKVRGCSSTIAITDIEEMIPIDKEGYNRFSTEYGEVFSVKEFEKEIAKVFEDISKRRFCESNCRAGIRLFRKYCGLAPNEINPEIEDRIVQGVVTRLTRKHFEIPGSEREPWKMLLAYERYEPYENDCRGLLLDIYEIVFYLMKSSFIGCQDDLLGKEPVANAIHGLENFKTWSETIAAMRMNERMSKFLDKVESFYDRLYIPLLFLGLKEKIRESKMSFPQEYVKKMKEQFPEETGMVANLIGVFFGYEKLREHCLGKNIEEIDTHSVDDPKPQNEEKQNKNTGIIMYGLDAWRHDFESIVLKGKRGKKKKEIMERFDSSFSISEINSAVENDDKEMFLRVFKDIVDDEAKLLKLFKEWRKRTEEIKAQTKQLSINF